MSELTRDLQRALLRGGFLAGAAWLGFLSLPPKSAMTFEASCTWGFVGLSLAVPLFFGLRLERGGRVPPLAMLALVFGSAFAMSLFGLFEGAYFLNVTRGSPRAGIEVVGQLADTLHEPFVAHEWWRWVLPWYERWVRDKDARAPIDTAIVVAAAVTTHVLSTWLRAALETRFRRGTLLRAYGVALTAAVAVCAAALLVSEDRSIVRRFTSATTSPATVAFLVFGLVTSLALGVAPVVDRLETRLFGAEEPRDAPAPSRARVSRDLVALTLALFVTALGWALHRRGHIARGVFTHVAFSPDGSLIAATTCDEYRVWALPDERPVLRSRTSSPSCISFSPDGERLATSGPLPEIASLPDGALIFRDSYRGTCGLVFTERGERFYDVTDYSVSRERPLNVWCGSRSDLYEVLQRPGTPGRLGQPAFTRDRLLIPQGTRALVLDGDTCKVLFARQTGAPLDGVVAAPRGGRAAWLHARQIEITDGNGAPESTLDPGAGVASAAFSPDGERLAVGGADGRLRIFCVEDGSLEQTFETDRRRPIAVAWSSRDEIASAGEDGVRLWKPDER